MADEAVTPQEPAPNYDAEASAIGWVAKEQFKGDPAKWVDAKTYLDRGREFVPFLKASNRRLESQVQSLQSELTGAKSLLRANEVALKEIQDTNSEAAKTATEQEIVDLKHKIVEARRAGDIETEEDLRDRLEETRARLRQPPAPAGKPANGSDFTSDPKWKQFIQDNPWWESDPVMRAASMAVSQQLASSGALNDLTPEQRFAKIASETKKRFGDNPRRSEPSRVSESRSSEASPSGGKTFSDLPPDVRDTCDRLGNRLVGPTKKFKSIDDWRADYAKTYFGS